MPKQVLTWILSLCVCLLLTTQAAAVVSEAEFDVASDRIDATVDRLTAMDFAQVARPAAALLVRRRPAITISGPTTETKRRGWEQPAYTVARLVWEKHTADVDADGVIKVLGDLIVDRHGDKDIRTAVIQTLDYGAQNRTIPNARYSFLYRVATDAKDDATIRCLAAEALMRKSPDGAKQIEQYGALVRTLPSIIRAQSTLAARHATFNDLTNIGRRLHDLPFDRFIELLRLGFELMEEGPFDTAAGAYGTARRLGVMLRRPDEFTPPQSEHRMGSGNLAPSYFVKTAENARQWWKETGRNAIGAIVP